jgi:phosphatidylglycerol:prolipoprotein diacylglycerol transferase
MFPKLISVDGFFIGAYGALVMAGFLAGLWLAGRHARAAGQEPERIANLAILAAIGGMVGAKLLLLVYDWQYFLRNPGEIFTLSTLRAGGVFYGGLLAALATAVIYGRREGLPFWKTADTIAPGLALGHAIGRIGCFGAGCCWGRETHLPWAVTFHSQAAHELTGVPLGVPLHPAQLYEVAAMAVIFYLVRRRFFSPGRADGSVIGLYVTLYAAVRFFLEFVRNHEQAHPWGGPLSVNQWVAAGLFVFGLWLLLRPAPVPMPVPSRPAARKTRSRR